MENYLDRMTLYLTLEEFELFFDCTKTVLAIFGAVYASKLALTFSLKLFSTFRTYILPRVWYDKDFSKKYGGKWAVVTGASDGIGKSYAIKLAERKMNVFLISRNIEKLTEVASEIKSLYNVEAKCFAMDLSMLSQPDEYEKLDSELQSVDVGVLVNNVGKMYDSLQYFLTVPKETQLQIINLNINSTILLTYMILPQMVSKQNGAIINIASGASLYPTPLMTTYCASKAFVDVFTKALEYEYSSEGIVMQAIRPFYVSTNMTYKAKPNFLLINPDAFVESAIRTLSISRWTYGHWCHGLFGLLGELMPERLFMFSAVYINPPLWSWLTGVQCTDKKTK